MEKDIMENRTSNDDMQFTVDKLIVHILPTRDLMGRACAVEAGKTLRSLLATKPFVNIIFASAPSQLEALDALRMEAGIEWNRVNAFHMDEYIGMPSDAPQSFGNYLRERFFTKLSFCQVFYMDGNAPDVLAECERYSLLLREYPVDVAFVGIGENGHLAFNDPYIADFEDPLLVKVNENLDAECRQQQVTDGWFKSLADVPNKAITITIPGLVAARDIFAIVPGKTKQKIVKRCLEDPIGVDCPGTILRSHDSAKLYLDADSAAILDLKRLKKQP
jgi:glucosamine-6-phosphate deaminase